MIVTCAHCGSSGSVPTADAAQPWFCCRGCRQIWLLLREAAQTPRTR